MKTKFEQDIKNKFENFETPYNPEEWDKLNKKLNGNSSNGNFKLIGLISVLFVTFSTSYYFISKNETSKRINNVNTSKIAENNANSKSNEQTNINAFEIDKTVKKQIKSTDLNKENKNKIEDLPVAKKIIIPDEFIIEPLSKSTVFVDKDVKSDVIQTAIPKENSSFELPTISNKCQNDPIIIKNSNEKTIVLSTPSNHKIYIEPKKQQTINLNEFGLYQLSFKDQDLREFTKTFNVNKPESTNLTVDKENTYKNGIPTITATSSNSTKWYLENHLIDENSKQVDLHLYKKGNYNLSIESIGTNGCITTKNETIKINEDYNLLAVSGFFPEDYNTQVNTFIPYALTQRNVKFTFIIIDPKDGSIIFESNDKLRPWNGVDPRNGQLVPQNSNWIWKVYIENPEKGENATYQGVIVRL